MHNENRLDKAVSNKPQKPDDEDLIPRCFHLGHRFVGRIMVLTADGSGYGGHEKNEP